MSVNNKKNDTRKIQFSGNSSFTTTLPKEWVEQNNLKAGEEITLFYNSDNEIVITPNNKIIDNNKEIKINIDKDDYDTILRKIVSLYVTGYNLIKISNKLNRLTSEDRESIKKIVRNNLVGTEIINDSTEEITIQVLLSFPELTIKNALRRMYIIAHSMHKDAITSISKIDKDAAIGVINSDNEVDRFSLYIIRLLKIAVKKPNMLTKIGLYKITDCLGYRLIVKSVERVADHATKIAQTVLQIENKIDKEIVTKLEELSIFSLEVFEDSSKALFKEDYTTSNEIVEKAKSIEKKERNLTTLLKNKDVQEQNNINLIIEHIRRTAEYASDIAEIILNMTAEKFLDKNN